MTLPDAIKLAVELLDTNRLTEAEGILAAVLKADPHSPDGLHFLGLLRCQQGRTDEAVELIRKAIDVAPTYAEAQHNLGNIFRAMKREPEAEQAFRRTIELAPDIAEAHLNLADLLRRSGRRAEAVPFYLRAIALQPTLAEAHFQLGKVYYRMGKMEEAAATFRNWLGIDPANPVARHMVAAIGATPAPDRASDDYVRCEFDEFADTFDEVMITLGYNAPQQIAAALADQMQPPRQLDVLDAGCGTGLVGAAVRPFARHLTGIDLSPAMIHQARQRGGYDELILGELTSFLETTTRSFDLIVSADTFIYFGALSAVFRGAGRCLRAGGYFVFSAEHVPEGSSENGFLLQPHGRYSHRKSYVRQCLEEAGLTVLAITQRTIRMELKDPVAGLIVTAVKR